jgi:hypothetical protein
MARDTEALFAGEGSSRETDTISKRRRRPLFRSDNAPALLAFMFIEQSAISGLKQSNMYVRIG